MDIFGTVQSVEFDVAMVGYTKVLDSLIEIAMVN
jgi:hypothetical protein